LFFWGVNLILIEEGFIGGNKEKCEEPLWAAGPDADAE
jgi:hypothetical protein